MKKLFTLVLSCFILVSINAHAVTLKADTAKKKMSKMKMKAADAKAAATTTATDTKTTATTTATKAKTTSTKAVTEGVNKSADKAIGKDSKGRTIYLGPKGGQYTLTEAGKKSYIKTADKLKVN